MPRHFVRLALFVLVIIVGAASIPAFAGAKSKDAPMPEPKDLPWNLRDHYTFTPERYEFIYGGDNGQWSLTLKGKGELLDKVNASVTFADGRVVDGVTLGVGVTNRQKLTAELGEGIEYIVNIPAKDGISMRHSVMYHNAHPFYVVRTQIKNEGAAPVEISKISPIVIQPGSFKVLSAQTTANYRRFAMQGPCPAFAPDSAPYAVFMHDPAVNETIAFGSLTNGRADTTVDMQAFSGAWQGGVTSTFDPPVRVEPGQTLDADPAWICYIMQVPSDVDLYYAQAHLNFPKPSNPKAVPNAWVTVKDGESLSALQSARANWHGIDAALVPVTWEGRPGSLEGASPDWPRDMKSAASQLKQGNGAAGITVDPLVVSSGNDAFTAKSEDGRIWVNPASAEGMEFGITNMKKVAGWGFDFYVVAPSRIPNEVLKHFNIPRARANALAFDMMLKAAGGAPVFASANGALSDKRDEWLEAAAATARLAEYGVPSGPVRLDGSAAKNIDDETALAVAFCGAPIEVVGNPSPSVRSTIAEAVSKRDFFARPLDIAGPAPKLWQVETTPGGSKESLEIAIVSFTGARASTDSDLKTYSGTPKQTEHAAAAGYLKQLPSGGPPNKNKKK
ncbi:MAG: hypothetical protein HUU46_10750 [Candidatus Hydrogenedentes bacterium]|nr:hypothetical protein [Candidatus Hydrogenedentota bacterium]